MKHHMEKVHSTPSTPQIPTKVTGSLHHAPPTISISTTVHDLPHHSPQTCHVPENDMWESEEETVQLRLKEVGGPSSAEMVEKGVLWMGKYGISVQGIGVETKPDGNCLQRASLAAMGRETTDAACQALRAEQVDIMTKVATEQSEIFTANFGMTDQNIQPGGKCIELYIFQEIDSYKRSGIFRAMGDAAPFSLAAATGHPLGIISLVGEDIGMRWVPSDGGLFTPHSINYDPILLVQRGSTQIQSYHFELLTTTSDESATALREMYVQWHEDQRTSAGPNLLCNSGEIFNTRNNILVLYFFCNLFNICL